MGKYIQLHGINTEQIQNNTVEHQYSTSIALANWYNCKLWGYMEGGRGGGEGGGEVLVVKKEQSN